MSETVEFQHKGTTYRVYEMTVIQRAIMDKLAADLKEAWIKKHDSDFTSYPRQLDTLAIAYVQFMFCTDIEGSTSFINTNPALANGQLVDAYESWVTVIMSDRDLQRKWDNAIKEANKALTDPEAESDAPSGENK